MASYGFTEYFEKEALRKHPYRLAEARAVARYLQQLVRPIGSHFCQSRLDIDALTDFT